MCFQVKSSIVLTPKDGDRVQLLVRNTPPHRLQRSAIQLCEVDREQRCLDVELDAERPVTEEEEEREFMGQIRAKIQAAQHGEGSGRESALEDPGE